MKEELYKIIDELYEEFDATESNVFFEVNGKEYSTDTGYAMDGIKFFITELKEKIELLFN